MESGLYVGIENKLAIGVKLLMRKITGSGCFSSFSMLNNIPHTEKWVGVLENIHGHPKYLLLGWDIRFMIKGSVCQISHSTT